MPAGEGGQALSMGVGCCVCESPRKNRKPVCMCVYVCVLVRPFSSAQGLSHTRLMAGVEVLKWMLQFLQTEPIHQI